MHELVDGLCFIWGGGDKKQKRKKEKKIKREGKRRRKRIRIRSQLPEGKNVYTLAPFHCRTF